MPVVGVTKSDSVVARMPDPAVDPVDRILQAVRGEREQVRVTLHVDLCLDDPGSARDLAIRLATAFGAVYAGVEPYSAQLSTDDRWTDARALFCVADGPFGAFCAYPAGHDGWHAEAGVDGLRWGDGDATGSKG